MQALEKRIAALEEAVQADAEILIYIAFDTPGEPASEFFVLNPAVWRHSLPAFKIRSTS